VFAALEAFGRDCQSAARLWPSFSGRATPRRTTGAAGRPRGSTAALRRRRHDRSGSTLHFGAGRLRIKTLPVKLSMKAPPTEIITLKNRTQNAIARLFIAELHTFAKPLKKVRPEPCDTSFLNKPATSSAPVK
jgi:hypothetical protein